MIILKISAQYLVQIRRNRSSKLARSDWKPQNTGVVLVSCCTCKCVPTDNSDLMDISEVTGCHSLPKMSFQWGSQKLFQALVSH